MSKTPLQQLIDILQQDLDMMPNPLSDKAAALYYCQAAAMSLLPTEREVIEDVWCDGNDGYGAAADYFTTKFNDNEPKN
jgi:hypothetical protein